MDLVRQKHYYFVHDLQQAFSPMTSTTPTGQDSGFPIIAVAIIGIFATGFLLVSYYVFVIKCCLNWHRIDLLILRRFSFSRSSRRMDVPNLTLNVYSTPQLLIDHDENNRRGLDETVIRSIPIIRYTKNSDHGNMEKYNCKGSTTTTTTIFCSSECAVCLNEFQEEEKLRIIPNCGHFFHIDCIDVWLQNNANCPLCRNSCISHDDDDVVVTSRFCGMGCPQQIMPPLASPPQNPNPNPNRLTAAAGGGGNFIPAAPGRDDDDLVIEINCEHNQTNDDDMIRKRILMMSSGELSTSSINYQYSSSMITPPSPSPRKLLLEPLKVSKKRKKKFHPFSSMAMGDECIDTRNKKDIDHFEIQPIRRSISMDSAVDPHLYLAVQEIIKEQEQQQNVSTPNEGGSRIKRSFFSFGHGKGSRNAVLPVHLEP